MKLEQGSRFRGMELVYKKPSDLIADPNNCKLHPESQVQAIARSIQSAGFLDPITIDTDNNIIDGHGRRLACMALGIEEIPCIVIPIHSAARKAYAIAHNRTTMSSSLDYDAIKKEMDRKEITSDELMLKGGFDLDSMRLLTVDSTDSAMKEIKEDSSAWSHLKDDVFKLELSFQDEDTRNKWISFLSYLDNRYPDAETMSDRLVAFLTETKDISNAPEA